MPLARLRIPTGWTVKWNTLSEPADGSVIPPCDDLTEDLLLLENPERGVVIDLGWLPEFSPEGRFVLTAIKHRADGEEAWERPLRVIECDSYTTIRSRIEEWLEDPSLTVVKR